MQLKAGETYNFFKNIKDWWIIKILEIHDMGELHKVEVIERIGGGQLINKGFIGYISLHGSMFTTYSITKYHKADIDESVDPEVEDLIAHVQKQFEINQLQEMIDLALKTRNEAVFIELTNELNKIKGVYA